MSVLDFLQLTGVVWLLVLFGVTIIVPKARLSSGWAGGALAASILLVWVFEVLRVAS